VGIVVLIALRYLRPMLITDRSWTVLLDVRIAKNRSVMSKPLSAIHHVADVILVSVKIATLGT
jgi:hypothetical protein